MSSLTRQEAQARTDTITIDGYELDVDLTGGAEAFRSTTTIRSTATGPAPETFVEPRPAVACHGDGTGVLP